MLHQERKKGKIHKLQMWINHLSAPMFLYIYFFIAQIEGAYTLL